MQFKDDVARCNPWPAVQSISSRHHDRGECYWVVVMPCLWSPNPKSGLKCVSSPICLLAYWAACSKSGDCSLQRQRYHLYSQHEHILYLCYHHVFTCIMFCNSCTFQGLWQDIVDLQFKKQRILLILETKTYTRNILYVDVAKNSL